MSLSLLSGTGAGGAGGGGGGQYHNNHHQYFYPNDLFGSDNAEYAEVVNQTSIPAPFVDPTEMNHYYSARSEQRQYTASGGYALPVPSAVVSTSQQPPTGISMHSVFNHAQSLQPSMVPTASGSSSSQIDEYPTHQEPDFLAGPENRDENYLRHLDFSSDLRVSAETGTTTPTSDLMSPEESLFCDNIIVASIFEEKSKFDLIDGKVFIAARDKANPYERLGRSLFKNRAAVKMANLDHLFKFLDIPLLKEEEDVLYFGDICSWSSGFTEYVYWRRPAPRSKGWGMMLRSADESRQDKFNPESIHDNFVTTFGIDDTGDITNNKNIKHFTRQIDGGTNGRGLALLLADGGVASTDTEWNRQETSMHQLLLCDCITALTALRKGGCFTCKIFDLFTPFTVGLVYIMHCFFERISIVKPFTCRPASSERYLACMNLQVRCPDKILKYLRQVNKRLSRKERVVEIVSVSRICADKTFLRYIRESNEVLAARQIKYLKEIIKHIEDPTIPAPNQEEIRIKCLEEWKLPAAVSRRDDQRRNRRRDIHDMDENRDGYKRHRQDDRAMSYPDNMHSAATAFSGGYEPPAFKRPRAAEPYFAPPLPPSLPGYAPPGYVQPVLVQPQQPSHFEHPHANPKGAMLTKIGNVISSGKPLTLVSAPAPVPAPVPVSSASATGTTTTTTTTTTAPTRPLKIGDGVSAGGAASASANIAAGNTSQVPSTSTAKRGVVIPDVLKDLKFKKKAPKKKTDDLKDVNDLTQAYFAQQ